MYIIPSRSHGPAKNRAGMPPQILFMLGFKCLYLRETRMSLSNSLKRFRIPTVDVSLNPVEVEIVHTRQFQRLFYLKQLGLAYLVYPGATHTRGVHSIETLYQATRIQDSLQQA